MKVADKSKKFSVLRAIMPAKEVKEINYNFTALHFMLNNE